MLCIFIFECDFHFTNYGRPICWKLPLCCILLQAQRKLPFQVVHSRHGSKAPVVSPSCSTKAQHQTTQPTLPLKEIKVQGSHGNGDSNWLAGENSDTTHQEDIRSQEKPGPSTRFTSSEDEEEEEEETFWIKVKRLKKSKHSLGNIKV